MSSNQGPMPQSLKKFVNATLSKCAPANRAEVEEELKGIISEALAKDELGKIDWDAVELESLNTNRLKRKTSSNHFNTISSDSKPSLPASSSSDPKRPRHFESGATSSSSSRRSNGQWSESPATRLIRNSLSLPRPSRHPLNQENEDGSMKRCSSLSGEEEDEMIETNSVIWNIVGTSYKLEKSYSPMNSAPDPRTVRPLSILKLSLELLKKTWWEEKNYEYICDQFRSMRQDLKIQGIKTDFTCTVYEIQARLALEQNDMKTFLQYLDDLLKLYPDIPAPLKHKNEFLAYRVLHLVFTDDRIELNFTLSRLSDEEKRDPMITYATEIRRAVSRGNYVKLFTLYRQAPNKSFAYLLEMSLVRERFKALLIMSGSYTKGVLISLMSRLLSFESIDDVETFLEGIGRPEFTEFGKGSERVLKVVQMRANIEEALARCAISEYKV